MNSDVLKTLDENLEGTLNFKSCRVRHLETSYVIRVYKCLDPVAGVSAELSPSQNPLPDSAAVCPHPMKALGVYSSAFQLPCDRSIIS